jgi:hypothetical protein
VQVDREDGWMTATPRVAAKKDQNLVNRASLAKLSRALRTQGYASLDQASEYVMSRRGQIGSSSLDEYWIKAINSVEADRISQEQAGMRLYASLPSSVKNTNQYRTEAAGTLMPIIAARLDSHVGGANVIGEGVAIMSYRGDSPQSRWIGHVDISEPLALNLIAFEYTQTVSPTLLVQRKSEGGGRFISPTELGVYRIMAKKPRYANFNSDLLPYDWFQKAKNRKIEMSLKWTPPGTTANQSMSDTLLDNQVEPNQARWTWETLPAEIKQQILDAEKRYADQIDG